MDKNYELQTEKRNRIVDIAYRLFIRKGLEKTSIRDIANVADINVNTLYYYFRTKAEIVICCVEYGLKQVSQRIFSSAMEGDISQDNFIEELLEKISD